jgi:hypothetical protein
VPVVVAVKEITALLTSRRHVESARTNWTIEPGVAVVPVWGWKRIRLRPVRIDDLDTPPNLAEAGTTSVIGIPAYEVRATADIIFINLLFYFLLLL